MSTQSTTVRVLQFGRCLRGNKFIFIVSIRCEPILDRGHVRDIKEETRSDLHNRGAHAPGFIALGYPQPRGLHIQHRREGDLGVVKKVASSRFCWEQAGLDSGLKCINLNYRNSLNILTPASLTGTLNIIPLQSSQSANWMCFMIHLVVNLTRTQLTWRQNLLKVTRGWMLPLLIPQQPSTSPPRGF